MQVWQTLEQVLKGHDRAAIVTVLDAKGSVPREAGARMIVLPSGDFHGTIGGGTLEWEALKQARAHLADTDLLGFKTRKFALGPELGQCCGGQATIALEVISKSSSKTVHELAERERGGRFSTHGDIAGDGIVRRQIMPDLDDNVRTASINRAGQLCETFGEDRRQLWLFGAGHVGRAIAMAMAPLRFQVTWVDSREGAFPAHVPANVTCRHVETPADAIAAAPDHAFVLVMTHSHNIDQDIIHVALSAARFDFIGLIGSASKRRRFESRMTSAGLPNKRLADLVCPIGLSEITSKEPTAIALGTAAQLVIVDERLRIQKRDTVAA